MSVTWVFLVGGWRSVVKGRGMRRPKLTVNAASLTSRLRTLFGRRPKYYAPALSWEFGGHVRVFTAGTLRRLLEHNGFDVEEIVSNLVSFVTTRRTKRPWSVTLGRLIPGLGEVLIVRGRKR